ncbi:hypothetical protein K2X33_13225, partial [bacterium]|nr:hypothetical protein [bacterium]
MGFLRTFFWSLVLAAPCLAAGPHFDQAKEFPHPLLSTEFRNLSPEALTGLTDAKRQALEAEITQMEGLLSRAMQAVFDRLTLPIIPTGETEVRRVFIFEYLFAELRKIDPDVELYPSGGVVRSALAYLIRHIRSELKAHPELTAQIILERFIADAQTEPKRPIAALEVRGVGSDFDCWARTVLFEQVKKRAIEILESAEQGLGFRDKGGMKKSLFAAPDVKPYEDQIDWATAEGGSTLDFLSFDMIRRAFIEPKAYPGIVRDFILGFYSYVAPQNADLLPDPLKQTVRGLRPLLEIPSLRLKDAARFSEEIDTWLKEMEEGKLLVSHKVVEQFAKMVRNATDSGAHNRFYRVAPDSLDHKIWEFIQAMEKRVGRSLFPEYVDQIPLEEKPAGFSPAVRERLLKNGGLMSLEDFIAKHTDKGIVRHGTPRVEYAPAILRQGLFISSFRQGTAIYGRGGYSNKDLATATGYAGDEGIVFDLQIKQDPRLVILDWEKAKDDSEIQALIRECESSGRDIFEVLAREYGVDIIVNNHVLLQNSEAIDFTDAFAMVVRAYRNVIYNETAAPSARLFAWDQYGQLLRLAMALDERNVPPPPSRSWLIAEISNPEKARARLAQAAKQRQEALALGLERYKAATDEELKKRIWNELRYEYLWTPALFEDGKVVVEDFQTKSYQDPIAVADQFFEGLVAGRIETFPGGLEGELWTQLADQYVKVLNEHELSAEEKTRFTGLLIKELEKGIVLRGHKLFEEDIPHSYYLKALINHIPAEIWRRSDFVAPFFPRLLVAEGAPLGMRIWFFQHFLARGDFETAFRTHPALEKVLDQTVRECLRSKSTTDEKISYETGFRDHDRLKLLITNPYFEKRGQGSLLALTQSYLTSGDWDRFQLAHSYLAGASEELQEAHPELFNEQATAVWQQNYYAILAKKLREEMPAPQRLRVLRFLRGVPSVEFYNHAATLGHYAPFEERLLELMDEGEFSVRANVRELLYDLCDTRMHEAEIDPSDFKQHWRDTTDLFMRRSYAAIEKFDQEYLAATPLDLEILNARKGRPSSALDTLSYHSISFLYKEDAQEHRPKAAAALNQFLTKVESLEALSELQRESFGREIQGFLYHLRVDGKPLISVEETNAVARAIIFPHVELRISAL